jgi:hypothetical protein
VLTVWAESRGGLGQEALSLVRPDAPAERAVEEAQDHAVRLHEMVGAGQDATA